MRTPTTQNQTDPIHPTSIKLPWGQGNFHFQKDKIETVTTEVTMFTLIFILILILPGAFLPMALKSLFSSEDLIEMGVSLEESQTLPSSSEQPFNYSQSNFLRPCAAA